MVQRCGSHIAPYRNAALALVFRVNTGRRLEHLDEWNVSAHNHGFADCALRHGIQRTGINVGQSSKLDKENSSMDVVILGITGRTGSRLSDELLRRGYKVTGVARNIEEVAPREGLTLVVADVTDTKKLAFVLKGHKIVISATRFVTSDINSLIAAVKDAGVTRLLVVGGAATLEVSPGVPMLDTPGFPEEYRAEATAGRDFLNRLRQEQSLNWTFLSPSADFNPGQRTGAFRLGKDTLLVDSNGKSWISMEDFAIAMVDELETPRHVRQRFTVGY